MSKKFFLLLMLGLAVLINGCWDRRELESLGLVQALGLDLGDNGRGVTITAMIAIPSQITGGQSGGGGGGGGDQSGVFTITMAAPTIYEAFNRINTSINRDITLIQNTVLIIGEDLAKQGVYKWIDTLVRFREMRRTMIIFVCRGIAADIMKVQPKLEKNPSEYFNDLAKLNTRNGMFPAVTVNDFLGSYEAFAQETYTPVLAKFQLMEPPGKPAGKEQKSGGQGKEEDSQSTQKSSQNDENIRIAGTAIFKDAKMVGTFDIYESQVLQLLTGNFREASLSIRDPQKRNNLISYRLLAANPLQIKYKHSGGTLEDKFQISLNLEADILSIQSGINYTTPKNEVLLGKHIAREIKGRVQKVIKKAQIEYGSDVFGLGKAVRNTFLTSTAWEKYHWPERFPNAKITANVKVTIRRVGVQFQPPEFR